MFAIFFSFGNKELGVFCWVVALACARTGSNYKGSLRIVGKAKSVSAAWGARLVRIVRKGGGDCGTEGRCGCLCIACIVLAGVVMLTRHQSDCFRLVFGLQADVLHLPTSRDSAVHISIKSAKITNVWRTLNRRPLRAPVHQAAIGIIAKLGKYPHFAPPYPAIASSCGAWKSKHSYLHNHYLLYSRVCVDVATHCVATFAQTTPMKGLVGCIKLRWHSNSGLANALLAQATPSCSLGALHFCFTPTLAMLSSMAREAKTTVVVEHVGGKIPIVCCGAQRLPAVVVHGKQ